MVMVKVRREKSAIIRYHESWGLTPKGRKKKKKKKENRR